MFRQIISIALLVAVLSGPAGAATLEITGPPGASLTINGQAMGFFPLTGPLDLAPGTYELESELPGYLTYENTVRLDGDADWRFLTVRLIPFSKSTAWKSNILFAGLGQHYLGQNTRGIIYNIAEGGGLLVALLAELDRNNLSNDYLTLQDDYNSSINADDISRYRQEMDQTYSEMTDAEDLRNLGLLVAGGAIVVSIIDVFLTFPGVEAGAGPVPLDTGYHDDGMPNPGNDSLTSVHAALRLEF